MTGPKVRIEKRIAAGLEVPPIVKIADVVRRGGDSGPIEHYFGTIASDQLPSITFLPMVSTTENPYLEERTQDGYQREPSQERMERFADYVEANPDTMVPPVVLSGRGRWTWEARSANRGALCVYDAAAVIDGQHRIGGYSCLAKSGRLSREVDFILIPNLDLASEKRYYVSLNAMQVGMARTHTALSRLKVSTDWITVELLSEPFVVPSYLGYGVMVEVLELDSDRLYGIYVNAKSLASALEELREESGSLIGIRLRLKKDNPDRFAPYVIESMGVNR